MLDSLGERIETEEFIQIYYNSWVNLKIKFAKRNILNTIWRIGIWPWNHLVLTNLKNKNLFRKLTLKLNYLWKIVLFRNHLLNEIWTFKMLFRIRSISLKHYLIVEISLSMIQKYFWQSLENISLKCKTFENF